MMYIFIVLTCFIFLLFYNYTLKEGIDVTDNMLWNDCDTSVLGDLSSQLGDEICDGLRNDANNAVKSAGAKYRSSDIRI